MKKLIAIFTLFFTLNTLHAAELSCGISPIPENIIEYGCGCNYHNNQSSTLSLLFQSEIDASNPRMFIEGELVKLTSSAEGGMPEMPKIGDKFKQTFSYKDKTIIFDNVINFVCPPESEGCEIISYDSSITINGEQCHDELTGYNGDCGC